MWHIIKNWVFSAPRLSPKSLLGKFFTQKRDTCTRTHPCNNAKDETDDEFVLNNNNFFLTYDNAFELREIQKFIVIKMLNTIMSIHVCTVSAHLMKWPLLSSIFSFLSIFVVQLHFHILSTINHYKNSQACGGQYNTSLVLIRALLINAAKSNKTRCILL